MSKNIKVTASFPDYDEGQRLVVAVAPRHVELRVLPFSEDDGWDANLTFNKPQKDLIVATIIEAGREAWPDIRPKEADSLASDWNDYYSKKFNNEGDFTITSDSKFMFTRPSLDSAVVFEFNKRMMQSFFEDFYQEWQFAKFRQAGAERIN